MKRLLNLIFSSHVRTTFPINLGLFSYLMKLGNPFLETDNRETPQNIEPKMFYSLKSLVFPSLLIDLNIFHKSSIPINQAHYKRTSASYRMRK